MIRRSVDDPPGIPAFTGIRGRRRKSNICSHLCCDPNGAGYDPTSLPVTMCNGGLSGNLSVTAASTSTAITPAKLVNLHSNYLHSLFESISELDCREQKAPILEQLKKLIPD